MNKLNYLTFSGVCLVIAGAAMLLSTSIGVSNAKIIIPIVIGLGGLMAFLFSENNKQHKIARQYHLLQGLGMLAFAIIIATVPDTLNDFLLYLTYFIAAFGILELMFGFMALNSGEELNMGILFSRFISGFFNIIGAVLILATSVTDEMNGLTIAGILVLIGGIAFIQFSFRIRKTLN